MILEIKQENFKNQVKKRGKSETTPYLKLWILFTLNNKKSRMIRKINYGKANKNGNNQLGKDKLKYHN